MSAKLSLPWLLAGLLSCITAAIIDAAFTIDPELKNQAFFYTWAACTGLYSMFGVVVFNLIYLVVSSMQAVIGMDNFKNWFRHTQQDQSQDRSYAATLLTLASIAVIHSVIIFIFYFTANSMKNLRNAALSTALVSLAALPLISFSFFPLYRVYYWAVKILPRPRLISTLIVLLSTGLAVAVLAVSSVDWLSIQFGPWKMLGLLAFLYIIFLMLFRFFPQRQFRLACWVFIATLGLPCIIYTSRYYTSLKFNHKAAYLAIEERTFLARKLAAILKKVVPRHWSTTPNIAAPLPPIIESPLIQPTSVPLKPIKPWPRNWLLITIDTLRADRIHPILTPNLWKLAQKSIYFQRAYAQAPNTPRSFPSFVTSRYPSQIKFTSNKDFSPIDPKQDTLFSALATKGYNIIGEFSHFYLSPERGFSRGFNQWNNIGAGSNNTNSKNDIAAPRITARVINQLETLRRQQTVDSKPFVLWTHLFDPHYAYMPHPDYSNRIQRPKKVKRTYDLEMAYDAEVAFTDAHIGMILDSLAKSGLEDSTAVVVWADHGEAFAEHKFGNESYYLHGEILYNEVIHVPWLMFIPQIPAAQITMPVRLVDLAPTILQLANVPIPAAFQGRSLAALIQGQPLAPAPVYAEILPNSEYHKHDRIFINSDYKLHYLEDGDNPIIKLFELTTDPLEKRDLSDDEDRKRTLDKIITDFKSFQLSLHPVN